MCVNVQLCMWGCVLVCTLYKVTSNTHMVDISDTRRSRHPDVYSHTLSPHPVSMVPEGTPCSNSILYMWVLKGAVLVGVFVCVFLQMCVSTYRAVNSTNIYWGHIRIVVLYLKYALPFKSLSSEIHFFFLLIFWKKLIYFYSARKHSIYQKNVGNRLHQNF